MALQPTFKPKPKDTYFIFNTKTGLYSRGGQAVKWGRSPKTWTKGGVKLHLVQHRHFYKPNYAGISYNFDTDFIYDMETNEPSTDITLAGFLIKSSYDDKMKEYEGRNKSLRGYTAQYMMYEEALKKGRAEELNDKIVNCKCYVTMYEKYVKETNSYLEIIKEYATKHNVTL